MLISTPTSVDCPCHNSMISIRTVRTDATRRPVRPSIIKVSYCSHNSDASFSGETLIKVITGTVTKTSFVVSQEQCEFSSAAVHICSSSFFFLREYTQQ